MLVVFGSLNVDLVFNVEAFPEPGKTYLCDRVATCAGGKGGNQAVAAAHAGSQVAMVGAVGDDAFGDTAQRGLRQAQVDVSLVHKVGAPTGCASIYVDRQAENTIVVASGANQLLRHTACPDALLAASTTLCLQMEVAADDNAHIAARARARGARTILNLAPFRPVPSALLKTIDYLLVNEHEAREVAAHMKLPRTADIARCAQALARHTALSCVVTLGSKGALAATHRGIVEVQARQVTPVDTTGAGDCFVGVFAAMLDRGAQLDQALRYASAAGTLCCLHAGTQPSMPKWQAIKQAAFAPCD